MNLCIHHPDPATLDEHAIEVEQCHLEANNCIITGGTRCIFASSNALVTLNNCCLYSAKRAGLTCFSGSRLKMKDSNIASNGEDGVTVCGWSSSKNAASTHISIETSKIFANEYHGVLVSGGGEAVLLRVDIYKNKRAGVFVLHEQSCCSLDVCRVTDNGWHGMAFHYEQAALPKSLKVKRSDLKQNSGEALNVNSAALVSRVRVDADTLLTAEDAFRLTFTDLQRMGIADSFVIRLILHRLAPCPQTTPHYSMPCSANESATRVLQKEKQRETESPNKTNTHLKSTDDAY